MRPSTLLSYIVITFVFNVSFGVYSCPPFPESAYTCPSDLHLYLLQIRKCISNLTGIYLGTNSPTLSPSDSPTAVPTFRPTPAPTPAPTEPLFVTNYYLTKIGQYTGNQVASSCTTISAVDNIQISIPAGIVAGMSLLDYLDKFPGASYLPIFDYSNGLPVWLGFNNLINYHSYSCVTPPYSGQDSFNVWTGYDAYGELEHYSLFNPSTASYNCNSFTATTNYRSFVGSSGQSSAEFIYSSASYLPEEITTVDCSNIYSCLYITASFTNSIPPSARVGFQLSCAGSYTPYQMYSYNSIGGTWRGAQAICASKTGNIDSFPIFTDGKDHYIDRLFGNPNAYIYNDVGQPLATVTGFFTGSTLAYVIQLATCPTNIYWLGFLPSSDSPDFNGCCVTVDVNNGDDYCWTDFGSRQANFGVTNTVAPNFGATANQVVACNAAANLICVTPIIGVQTN